MIALALLPLCAALAAAEEPSALVLARLQDETAARMQSGVLDPILGPGRSSVFVRLGARVTTAADDEEKSGVGSADKSWDAAASSAAAAGLDFRDGGQGESRQSSRQKKGHARRVETASLELTDLRVVVLYDVGVPAQRLETARRALLVVYEPALKVADLTFEAAQRANAP